MYLKKNIYLFYAIEFFTSCVFSLPIRYFFFVNYLHFWIWIAIFIRTLAWFIEVFFEVPSGWWADRYGRKKLFFIGMLSLIIGFSFYIFFKQSYYFIFSAIFIWFWYAVTSWNLEALIHDNLDELWKWDDYDKIQSNQSIFMYLWRASSSFFAWYLYFYAETLPYIATIICFFVAIILVFFIHSPKQELSQESNNITHMKKAFLFLSKKINMIMIIMFVGFILSWIWNIYWFTYQPYLEKIWININNIWIIYFFVSIFSASGSFIIKNIKLKFDIFEIMKYMLLILFFISLMFHYIDNIFWIIPIMLLSVWFWFITFLWNTYLIKASPKTHKSTILSIFSLSVSLGYFIFWSISWYIVEIFSLEFLYALLPFVISWMIFIYFYLIWKKV